MTDHNLQPIDSFDGEARGAGFGGVRKTGELNEHTTKIRLYHLNKIREQWNISEVSEAFPTGTKPSQNGLGTSAISRLYAIASRVPVLAEAQALFLDECKHPETGQPVPVGFAHLDRILRELRRNDEPTPAASKPKPPKLPKPSGIPKKSGKPKVPVTSPIPRDLIVPGEAGECPFRLTATPPHRNSPMTTFNAGSGNNTTTSSPVRTMHGSRSQFATTGRDLAARQDVLFREMEVERNNKIGLQSTQAQTGPLHKKTKRDGNKQASQSISRAAVAHMHNPFEYRKDSPMDVDEGMSSTFSGGVSSQYQMDNLTSSGKKKDPRTAMTQVEPEHSFPRSTHNSSTVQKASGEEASVQVPNASGTSIVGSSDNPMVAFENWCLGLAAQVRGSFMLTDLNLWLRRTGDPELVEKVKAIFEDHVKHSDGLKARIIDAFVDKHHCV